MYGINSYIAVPLIKRDGEVFGTLCALDPNPSSLSERHLQHLTLLANLVAFEVEIEERQLRHMRETEDRYRSVETKARIYADIVHTMRLGLYVWKLEREGDPSSFRLVAMNQAATALTGLSIESTLGRALSEVMPELSATDFPRHLLGVIESLAPFELETACSMHREQITHFELKAFPLPDRSVALLFEDVTARRGTETALRRSESRNRAFVRALPDTMLLVRRDGTIADIKPGRAPMLCAPGEAVTRPIDTVLPRSVGKRVHRACAMAIHDGRMRRSEYRLAAKNGPRYCEARVTSGGGDEALVVIRDITEERQAALDLQDSEERLRALSARLLAVQEEERKRIAREIHDELGQSLSALKIDVLWLAEHLGADPALVARKSEKMTALIDHTIREVRTLSHSLRPTALDDLGLVPAIAREVSDFRERTHVSCELHLEPEDLVIESPEVSTAVFRLVQESLTNVVRHARASNVSVALARSSNELTVTIRDNGVGIRPAATKDRQSLGLAGIRERVLACGGDVTINGSRGRGTTLTARIPLRDRGMA